MRIRRLSRSTTPRLPSHTRTPSSKSLASKRSRSNTVPLLSVTRTSRPRASMRAMSPKRAMNSRPRSIGRSRLGDLDPEDLDRAALLGQPLGRHVGDPGVLVLGAVEVVAPERLLVASPAQPPLVGGAVDGGDAAVEEARVGLRRRRRGRGGDRGRVSPRRGRRPA